MRTRKSGIANLLGAIFFILVVGLVISTLIVIFSANAGFVGGIHTTNSQAMSTTSSVVDIQNMSFGATFTKAQANIALNSSFASPVLPVTNMNLTESSAGWYTSESFPPLNDNASVVETNTTSTKLPSQNGFDVNVTNTDASGTLISKVTVLLDTNLTSVQGFPASGVPAGWAVTWTGNNVTWYASTGALPYPFDPANGYLPTVTGIFAWKANVPARQGTLYQTVIVSWYKSSNAAYRGTGIATVNANTTAVGKKFWLEKGVSSAVITGTGTHVPYVPGGLTAGYDGNALATTSDSGPGSLYVDFQPAVNGSAIPAGHQLTGVASLTAPFTLTSNIPTSPGCCTVTWESSLDSVLSVHNPLVVYHLYLSNSTWSVDVNMNGTNPTLVNYFKPSGWQSYSVTLTPAMMHNTNTLEAGSYDLIISVSITLPSGAPSGVLMHFDDIGVALSLPPTSTTVAYGSKLLSLNVGVPQTQVQGLRVGLNFTGGNATSNPYEGVYVFAADTASGIARWAELGSVTLSTSATVQSVVPLPNAAYYVTPAGYLNLKVSVVVPVSSCAASASCTSLAVSVYAVVASTNESRGVVIVEDEQGSSPLHLTSMYIAGPNGLTTIALNNYLVNGDLLIVPANNFQWITGQSYTVTVSTASGASFSRTFVAPIA